MGEEEFTLVKCQGQKDGILCPKWLRVPSDRGNLQIHCPNCGWNGRWAPPLRRSIWPKVALATIIAAGLVAGYLVGRPDPPTSKQEAALYTVKAPANATPPEGVSPSQPAIPPDAPLHWRLGPIDPRFNLTESDLKEALKKAMEVWNKASGRQLFRNDESDGFPISLVYDDRQAKLASEKAAKGELSASKEKVDASKLKLDAADEELRQAQARFKDEEDAYSAKIRDYNDRVSRWNEAGGALRT